MSLTTEVALECEVEWDLISKGRPASGPTYSCAGEPAEPPEFEITVRCNGIDITSALSETQMDEIRNQVEEEYNTEPDFEPDDSDY